MTLPHLEQEARQQADAALIGAGWVVQDMDDLNLAAGQGIAAREFPMAKGHGRADYLLFVDGKAVGALEAKKAGYTLASVLLARIKAEREKDGAAASVGRRAGGTKAKRAVVA